jgi:hypothetical protein
MMKKDHGDRVPHNATRKRATPESIGRMIRENHRECEERARKKRASKE